MLHWQKYQQSSDTPLLSGKLVRCRLQKAVLLQVYLWVFCLRTDVCNCKEVCILALLDVDSVPHVFESLFKHC